jgi:hypothetical protein
VTWLLLLLLLCLWEPAYVDASMREDSTWNFDEDRSGELPPKFMIGTFFDGRPAGDWQVMSTPKALSPQKVFAQIREKGAGYNVVLIEDAQAANLDLSVSFLPISGKTDMGGGLIWRAADDRNYYLIRANPLEQNIRLYHVVQGIRKMLKNHDEIIDIKMWHRLDVVNQGCRIQIFYDKKLIFDLCDETFKEGRIGLWTKSDAVTYFDDLRLQLLR